LSRVHASVIRAFCDCDDGWIGSPGVSASACYPATTETGTRRDTDDGIACDCNEGYNHVPDQIECSMTAATCAELDCDVNATCQQMAAGFVCACKPNYEGNGQTCTFAGVPCGGVCKDNATCVGDGLQAICLCDAGYFGDGATLCHPEVTATGTCTATPSGTVNCTCNAGFAQESTTAPSCTDIDECRLPDQGGCEAWCTNTPGSSTCTSTVADEDSPYWANTCDPTFSHTAGQTNLIADCRCGTNTLASGPMGLCQRPTNAASKATPIGIVRISKDGTQCTWVRRANGGSDNAFFGQDIGSGAAPQAGIPFRSCCLNHNPMFFDEQTGDVLIQHDLFGLVRIEVATGNTVTISL
jgi:hypothetical protein